MTPVFLYKIKEIIRVQSRLIPALFYSREVYSEIAMKWRGLGVRMLLAIIILLQFPLATINYMHLSKVERMISRPSATGYGSSLSNLEQIWHKLPKLRLYPDRYELEASQTQIPFIIKNQSGDGIIFAADTREEPENLFTLKPRFLLTRHALFISPSNLGSDTQIVPSQLWDEFVALKLVKAGDEKDGILLGDQLLSSLLSSQLGKLVAILSLYDTITTFIVVVNYTIYAALLLLGLSIVTDKPFLGLSANITTSNFLAVSGWSASIRTLNFAAVPGLIILTTITIAIRMLFGSQFTLLSVTIWSYPWCIWITTGYYIFAVYSCRYSNKKKR